MKKLRFCLLLATLTVWLVGCNSSSNSTTEGGDGPENQEITNSGGGDDQRPVGSNATDFATFFDESLVGRANGNIEEALKAIIHPDMGVFLIYKPGAIQRPILCKSIQDLKDVRISIVEEFVGIKTKAQAGELPFFDCDTFDKTGTFYKAGGNNGLLGSTYHDMEEMLSVEVPADELAAAKKSDATISTQVVNTDSFLQLGFGQIEGKWYLLSIDIAIFDCGA